MSDSLQGHAVTGELWPWPAVSTLKGVLLRKVLYLEATETAAVAPASTVNMAPVIHLASSLARKRIADAQSQAFPSVLSRLLFFLDSRISELIPPPYIMGVYSMPASTVRSHLLR